MNTAQYTGMPTGNVWQRRQFVSLVLAALGSSCLATIPAVSTFATTGPKITSTLTVQQVIDLILKSIPGAPFKETVDTIKTGNANQTVKGIVTTMFATDAVIQMAIKQGANFIIAHEPTFYNHLDETNWLEHDEVYAFKKNLLQKNEMVVWRFHDYWHSHQPDGIRFGVLQSLGWEKQLHANHPEVVELPATTLGEIVNLLKKKLGIQTVKVIGNPAQHCRRIAILPGMAGGRSQIAMLQNEKPDLLICGELNEWETSEYIRDARFQGMETSLIVAGHAVSEEPGMRWLVEWLQPRIPGIPVTHIPSGDPFVYM